MTDNTLTVETQDGGAALTIVLIGRSPTTRRLRSSSISNA